MTKIINVLGVAQNKGQSIYNNVRWQRYISIHMPFMRLGIRTRWISGREYDMLLRSCHHFILLYELRHEIAEILLIKIKLALNTNQSINQSIFMNFFILLCYFFFYLFCFESGLSHYLTICFDFQELLGAMIAVQ